MSAVTIDAGNGVNTGACGVLTAQEPLTGANRGAQADRGDPGGGPEKKGMRAVQHAYTQRSWTSNDKP